MFIVLPLQKRLAVLTVFCLLAMSLLSAASSAVLGYSTLNARVQRKPAPRVVIQTTTRDFGEVFEGEELEHVFMVTNTGDAPLELSEKKLAIFREHAAQRYRAVPAASARLRNASGPSPSAAPS
jgi:hypothetical protein